MVKLSEKEVKDLIKKDLNKCKSVFNGQKVKIYKGFKRTDGLYDLIVFKHYLHRVWRIPYLSSKSYCKR